MKGKIPSINSMEGEQIIVRLIYKVIISIKIVGESQNTESDSVDVLMTEIN